MDTLKTSSSKVWGAVKGFLVHDRPKLFFLVGLHRCYWFFSLTSRGSTVWLQVFTINVRG